MNYFLGFPWLLFPLKFLVELSLVFHNIVSFTTEYEAFILSLLKKLFLFGLSILKMMQFLKARSIHISYYIFHLLRRLSEVQDQVGHERSFLVAMAG